MVQFSEAEKNYIETNTTCRLATASRDNMPHVTPVVYVFDGKHFFIAIDYGEKKLKNLKENSKCALVIDDRTRFRGRGIMIQGMVEILERGEDYRYALKILFDKFEMYRKNPWGEGESPILKITPLRKASWGIAKA